jgi:hypothetical protein
MTASVAPFVLDKSLDQPYLERLKGVEVRPVFIIAPHRSGTTLLYRILVEGGSFNAVTVHHILNRHRLLHLHFTNQDQAARQELNRIFESKGIRGESMNSREFSGDVLEEYCYAFDRQGRRPRLAPDNAEEFQRFCKKLQVIQDFSRPLLLKNPYDGVGFLYLAEVFPDARFIFIYRNPVDVINSKIRLNRLLLSKKFEYHAMVVQDYARLFDKPMKLAMARLVFSSKLPLMTELVYRDVSRSCDYVREKRGQTGGESHGSDLSRTMRGSHPSGTPGSGVFEVAGHQPGLFQYDQQARARYPSGSGAAPAPHRKAKPGLLPGVPRLSPMHN